MGRVKKVLRRRYQHQVLLSRVTDTGKLRNIAIAQGFTDFVRLLSGYDAIIQVGGSFLSIFTACRSSNMRSVRLWPKSRCI
jgi:colanic acid/amylovoran biosynthesis protein